MWLLITCAWCSRNLSIVAIATSLDPANTVTAAAAVAVSWGTAAAVAGVVWVGGVASTAADVAVVAATVAVCRLVGVAASLLGLGGN